MPSPSSGATTAGGERPRYEVADIVRAYGAVYQRTHGVSAAQAVVLRALTRCRTAALGGHIEACEACGTRRIAYNSCRNRHCAVAPRSDQEDASLLGNLRLLR